MKLTNNGDIDGWVQLLPSFPPSLMLDPVDVKAGFTTKKPVWGRIKKTPDYFFRGRKPLSSFYLPS